MMKFSREHAVVALEEIRSWYEFRDHLERDKPAAVVFAGLEQGRKHVEAEHNITIQWVPDVAGDSGVAAGEATVEVVLAHGPRSVLVTPNCDDPPIFGTELTGEYRTAAAMGLTPAALAQLARNGVHASFAEPVRKTALVAEIDAIPVPSAAAPGTGKEDML